VGEEGQTAPVEPGHEPKRPLWQRLLRKKLFWTAIVVLLLLWLGSYQYDRLILTPPEDDWESPDPEQLLAEKWYESRSGRELSEQLAAMTGNSTLRFATGLYFQQYKRKYSSGVRNTQYVKVGPDQYPDLYEMVVDACHALGTIDGEPIPVPQVYLGWTGKRGFEVTNFHNPCLVIGNDFLWAFKPAELRYLIARQIGHVQCRHIFLLDVVKGVRSLLNSALPDFLAEVILGGLGGTLLNWVKEAQISADRAGLLVTCDVDVACNALIKLNIHASLDDFYGQASPEQYASQLQLLEEGKVATASAVLAELRNANPFLTVRVDNLLKFYAANQSLFCDRQRPPATEHVFDPGVLPAEEVPTAGGDADSVVAGPPAVGPVEPD